MSGACAGIFDSLSAVDRVWRTRGLSLEPTLVAGGACPSEDSSTEGEMGTQKVVENSTWSSIRLHTRALVLLFATVRSLSWPLTKHIPVHDASPSCLFQCPFTPFVPLIWLFLTFRLALTASASCSSTSTVVSQLIHASVILTPFFKLARPPSGGTF